MKNLFVGNLSFGSREEDLRSLFAQYGTVDRVQIVTDRDTGQSRGFGFVEMANDAEAEAAIEGLNGYQLGGRSLSVNEARPREEGGRGAYGGGGGSRSGGGGNRGGGFGGNRGGGGRGGRDRY